MKKHTPHWILWSVTSILLATFLYYLLVLGEDKTALMPGPLNDGHHQLADNCAACHKSPFGGGEVLQESCIECHGEERVKPHDSHPQNKFKDPRNADLLSKIDALSCTTCHTEHTPEITHKNGVTQPVDFCVHCHQDVGLDRVTHKNLEFDSCANAGCHNFHNNRAIYTDFLVKHLDKPDLLERHRIKPREFSSVLDELMEYPHAQYPVQELLTKDIDQPEQLNVSEGIINEWAASGHAKSGVNCSACHTEDKKPETWSNEVDHQDCNTCHNLEVQRFQQGKHGMRLAADLPAMKVKDARLPMHAESGHKELDCNSCHTGHDYNSVSAATEACLSCHNDEHSQNYTASPHAQLWQAEVMGEAKPNTGVSCASCHMPRISYDVNDWVTRIMVDHNQSANLAPNSKMARSVCMNCHGLDFSLKALSDAKQITSNFAFSPEQQEHPSMQLARRDNERYLRETSGDQSR